LEAHPHHPSGDGNCAGASGVTAPLTHRSALRASVSHVHRFLFFYAVAPINSGIDASPLIGPAPQKVGLASKVTLPDYQSMNTNRHLGPSPAIKKANGQWTFYVYPDGEEREAGQYETEAEARDARFKAVLSWGANGEKYGSLGVIPKVKRFRELD
jgi:hypothetical protein